MPMAIHGDRATCIRLAVLEVSYSPVIAGVVATIVSFLCDGFKAS